MTFPLIALVVSLLGLLAASRESMKRKLEKEQQELRRIKMHPEEN